MTKHNNPLVLMYHGIIGDQSEIPPKREAGAHIYDLSKDQFTLQIKHLKKQEYAVVPLDRISNDKDIIVTFDDGELNNYTQAFKVLKQYQCFAYFFIIVERVGTEGYMTWPQLKEMAASGMIIGSHGLSHCILTELSDDDLQRELKQSKEILEKNLGKVIDTISIPRGFSNDKIIEKAHELGYKNVFISQKPTHMTTEAIMRTAVKGNWNLKRFIMALQGKSPLKEKLICRMIGLVKLIIGDKGYNALRGILVKS